MTQAQKKIDNGGSPKKFNISNLSLSNMVAEKANVDPSLRSWIYNKKKWFKLHLWHPLNPHPVLWITIIVMVFTISFFLFTIALSFSSELNLSSALGISLSSMFSIIIVFITQNDSKRLNYGNALKRLLREIEENKCQFNEFINNINTRFIGYQNTNKWNWMPKKISYTDWSDGNNFQYKYYGTSAYFNFVSQRYIQNSKYFPIPSGQIANLYELFKDFNVKLQHTENLINRFDLISWKKIPPETKNFYANLLNQEVSQDKIPFKDINQIHEVLIKQFFDYFSQNYENLEPSMKEGYKEMSFPPNNGLYKNFQPIYNTFNEYFDFNPKIWEKETVEYYKEEAKSLIINHPKRKKLRFKELALYFISSTLFFIVLYLLKIYETPKGLALFIFLLITVAIILIWSIIYFNSLNRDELDKINTYKVLDKSDEKKDNSNG